MKYSKDANFLFLMYKESFQIINIHRKCKLLSHIYKSKVKDYIELPSFHKLPYILHEAKNQRSKTHLI